MILHSCSVQSKHNKLQVLKANSQLKHLAHQSRPVSVLARLQILIKLVQSLPRIFNFVGSSFQRNQLQTTILLYCVFAFHILITLRLIIIRGRSSHIESSLRLQHTFGGFLLHSLQIWLSLGLRLEEFHTI